MSGQSIQDRIIAAKHSISGQGLAKSVCKATTEEVMGPKKKHLDYLIQCTHEPNVSIPQLANLLIERTQTSNWVIVFKALVTLHNLMNYGNERFTQYLASNNCTLNLSNFIDKSGAQGYDMSTYVRRYAKYLNEKAYTYRTMAFDFCKVKRGKTDGLLRTMPADKLLKSLPALQHLLDTLVEFDVSANELTNGVVNAAFMLLFKDLIRLFACYNDGIINLLEKYFDMQKKQCREALEIYKRFLARMERCAEFLKVAENMGIDKGDIPDLAKAPSSLLEALEEHLKALEGTKKSKATAEGATAAGAKTPTTPQIQSPSSPTSTLSEEERRRIIEEESQQLERYEKKVKDDIKAPPSLTSPSTEQPKPSLMGDSAAAGTAAKSSDNLNDLLSLEPSTNFTAPGSTVNQFGPAQSAAAFDSNSLFMQQPQAAPNQFAGAGMQQMPNMTPWPVTGPPGFSFGGGVLQPQNQQQPPMMQGNGFMTSQPLQPSGGDAGQQKLIQDDIDSSLVSLAGNLSVGATGKIKTDQQWNKPTEKKLTGGTNWQNPRAMAPATMMQPMGAQMPMMGGMQPTMGGMQPAMGGMQPAMGSMQPAMGGMQPAMGGMQPAMFGAPGQPAMMNTGNAMFSQAPAPQQQQHNPQDPFGAL